MQGASVLALLICTAYVPGEKLSGPLGLPKVSPRGMQDSPAIKTSTGNPGLRLVASRNAVHDVEVIVIGGEAVRGQNKAQSCKLQNDTCAQFHKSP